MILHRKNSGSDAIKNNCIPYAVKGDNGPGDGVKLVLLIKQTVRRLEQNIKMTVLAFWFDRKKELHYIRFLLRELYAGRVFK